MFRLLVTGARIWDDTWTLSKFLNDVYVHNPDMIVIHGGCPSGADQMAEEWASRNGVPTEIHLANWQKHGKPAGHIRNKEMVDTKPDYAVAFIKGEAKGTRNCISHIEKAGIPYARFEESV